MRVIRSAGGFDGLAAIERQCGAFFGVFGRDCGLIGHAARVAPMRDYCSGLLLDCERKSAEPIAAATAPHATAAADEAARAENEAWIIDDPKTSSWSGCVMLKVALCHGDGGGEASSSGSPSG